MKILELHVEGFRSLKDVIWKPGDLNVIIGPNGAGKSNLLRLLECISMSAKGQLGEHIKSLGGIDPLLWDGNVREIHWKTKASPVEDWRDLDRDSLTYETALAQIGTASAYRVEQELLGNYYRMEKGERTEPFKLIDRDRKSTRLNSSHTDISRMPSSA